MGTNSLTPIAGNRRTLAAQVQDSIRQAILKQILKPGERIDQNRLADELQVSLAHLREALRGLAAEGLGIIQPRQGAVVGEVSISDTV